MTKIKKETKTKKYLLIFLIISLLVILGKFLIGKLQSNNNFENAFAKRHLVDSPYLNRMKNVNKNFIMDHNYQIGKKYVESKFYRWSDKTDMTFDKMLSIELKDYLSYNKISPDKISISLVSMKDGNKFSFNDKKEKTYSDIDKMLVNMALIKLINQKEINADEKISLKRYDLTADSVYFNKQSLGLTYDIRELMKLSLVNNDIVAKNMLKRHIIEKTNEKYRDILKKHFNIIVKDNKFKTYDTVNIAREILKFKDIYRGLLAKDKKTGESQFIKYIVKGESQNYFLEKKESYYDIGYVSGSNEYIYSIYIENQNPKNISEIGDLIDRKINEYYLLKNI